MEYGPVPPVVEATNVTVELIEGLVGAKVKLVDREAG
jgi:hypothetical protein